MSRDEKQGSGKRKKSGEKQDIKRKRMEKDRKERKIE